MPVGVFLKEFRVESCEPQTSIAAKTAISRNRVASAMAAILHVIHQTFEAKPQTQTH